jgi:hypothetical protein
MRRLWFIVSLWVLLPLNATPAFSQPPPAAPAQAGQGTTTVTTTGKTATAPPGKTEIVTDEKAHAVRTENLGFVGLPEHRDRQAGF